MTAMKRYTGVALLMAGIVALCAAVTAFTGVRAQKSEEPQSHGNLRVVCSFYPVYVAALNVCDGVKGVELSSLTGPTAGCLHDYQLSPDNRITLSEADLLVINGAGAESFLDQTLAQLPELSVVDTSQGVSLLESGAAHEHVHEDGDHEDGGDHSHEAVNEHIWTSPSRYRRQVENLRDGLCAADPVHAQAYRDNATAYLARIDDAAQELEQAAQELPARSCITFHDSLAYFAQELGITVLYSLHIGEESGVSASDVAAAEQAAKAAGDALLLYDSQYPVQYEYIGGKGGVTLTLDMAVSGEAGKDAWLTAMRRNAAALRAAAG